MLARATRQTFVPHARASQCVHGARLRLPDRWVLEAQWDHFDFICPILPCHHSHISASSPQSSFPQHSRVVILAKDVSKTRRQGPVGTLKVQIGYARPVEISKQCTRTGSSISPYSALAWICPASANASIFRATGILRQWCRSSVV